MSAVNKTTTPELMMVKEVDIPVAGTRPTLWKDMATRIIEASAKGKAIEIPFDDDPDGSKKRGLRQCLMYHVAPLGYHLRLVRPLDATGEKSKSRIIVYGVKVNGDGR